MRGIAVLLVVVHHAWPGALPGGFVGVDVFFTVSGFVIGSLLLGEIGRAGTVNLYHFWTRRARRILPASLVVVAATLLATWLWAPPTERENIGVDGLWATLFAANARFIEQGVDYAASERDPSPFQHFWSLAVEEQFYVVIPAVVALTAAIARRRGWPAPRLLAGVMLAVCVVSLAHSVHLTADSQTVAYFSPLTRAWQLAAGVAAACVAPAMARRAGRLRDVCGLVGMLALAGTVATLEETGLAGTGYPSYLSAGPTLATVAILLAGAGSASVGARILSVRPLRRVGDVSYSLYLWHWPVQVVAAWLLATGPLVNGLLVAISYALAELSYRLVEDPVRRSSWLARRPDVTALVALSSIGLVTACAGKVASFEARVAVQVAAPPAEPDAAPGPSPTVPDTELVPEPVRRAAPGTLEIDADAIHADYPDGGEQRCQRDYTGGPALPDVRTCTFGSGSRSVYLIGDSMAIALSPAVLGAATVSDARVTIMAKASCTLASGITVLKDQVGGAYRDCGRFRENLLDHLEKARPDVVLMVNSNGSAIDQIGRDGRPTRESTWLRATTAGVVRTVERLDAAGIDVVLVENPAKPGGNDRYGTACLINGGTVEECSFRHTPSVGAYELAYRRLAGRVPLVRVNTPVCPANRCLPVVGDMVVWRDHSHFTETYTKTLAPVFTRALRHTRTER